MIATPEIVRTTTEMAAVIHLTIPRAEMMKSFGPAVGELVAELKRQGVTPQGAVFAHHLTMSATTFDFELGFKINTPVKTNGRVKPGELPAARVARTLYSGPYEGLHPAWSEFNQWMKANGLRQADDLWEVYLVGPESTSDPSNWRTELNRPLKD
jgi:effector-binding domain-containing protein